jgi:hypothetical protein
MNYNELIEGLIDINKQYRKMFGENKNQYYSPLNYAREFCTVAVDIGRGVGKTYFIKNHATKGDLVIAPNFFLLKGYGEEMPEFDVITFNNLDKLKGRKPYNTIYVDEPKFVDMREVYELLVNPTIEQTFVLLGSNIR